MISWNWSSEQIWAEFQVWFIISGRNHVKFGSVRSILSLSFLVHLNLDLKAILEGQVPKNRSRIHYKYFQDKNTFWPLTQILFYMLTLTALLAKSVIFLQAKMTNYCLKTIYFTVILLRMMQLKCKVSEFEIIKLISSIISYYIYIIVLAWNPQNQIIRKGKLKRNHCYVPALKELEQQFLPLKTASLWIYFCKFYIYETNNLYKVTSAPSINVLSWEEADFGL